MKLKDKNRKNYNTLCGGEREIRTLGTCFHVRSFSKRLV